MQADRETRSNGQVDGARGAARLDIPAAVREEVLRLERALLREQVNLHRFNTEVFKAKALTLQAELRVRELAARIDERASAVARRLRLDDDAVIDFVACKVVRKRGETVEAALDRRQGRLN